MCLFTRAVEKLITNWYNNSINKQSEEGKTMRWQCQ